VFIRVIRGKIVFPPKAAIDHDQKVTRTGYTYNFLPNKTVVLRIVFRC